MNHGRRCATSAVFNGLLGVQQDNIQAYMWLSLAVARSDQDAISNRNRVAQKMTPAQIAEAQKLAVEWKSKPER